MSVFLGLFDTSPAGTVPRTPQLQAELLSAGLTATAVWDTEALKVSLTGDSPLTPAQYATAVATVAAHVPAAVTVYQFRTPQAIAAVSVATLVYAVPVVDNNDNLLGYAPVYLSMVPPPP